MLSVLAFSCFSLCAGCSGRCSPSEGCWGPGDDQCRSCVGYRRVDTMRCLNSCDDEPRLYADNERRECRVCDVECLDGCHGEVLNVLID